MLDALPFLPPSAKWPASRCHRCLTTMPTTWPALSPGDPGAEWQPLPRAFDLRPAETAETRMGTAVDVLRYATTAVLQVALHGVTVTVPVLHLPVRAQQLCRLHFRCHDFHERLLSVIMLLLRITYVGADAVLWLAVLVCNVDITHLLLQVDVKLILLCLGT